MKHDKSLITPHSKQTSHYSHTGGEGAHIDTFIHYDHLGGGKVDVVVEHKQDVSEIAQLNAIYRGLSQQGWGEGLGRMTANIPKIVCKEWIKLYGFDLQKANLNDPKQKEIYNRLLNMPEYRYCRTYEVKK